MNKKYKVGVVAGKFRILHIGHIGVMKKALEENIDRLVIIITNNDSINRYSTINELKKSINEELFEYSQQLNKEYEIITTNEKFEDLNEWELFVIKACKEKKEDIIIYNSKEDYPNVLLKNKYLKFNISDEVSATEIEKKPFKKENIQYVVPSFKNYLNNILK